MSDAYGFNSTDVTRIGKSVRTTEKLAPPTLGGGTDSLRGFGQGAWVQLGAEDTSHLSHYKWTTQSVASGVLSNGSTNSGSHYTAWEVNKTSGLANKFVRIFFGGVDSDHNTIYLFDYSPAPLYPVSVAQTGGSNGTQSTGCTFTYVWTDPSGGTHTGASATWSNRPSIGAVVAATHGLAQFNGTTWTLYMIDEAISAESCTT